MIYTAVKLSDSQQKKSKNSNMAQEDNKSNEATTPADIPSIEDGKVIANGEAKTESWNQNNESSISSDSGHDMKTFIQEEELQDVARKRHLVEKLVFLITVVTMIVLAYSIFTLHWFLPYYYTVSTPTLILLRLIIYWKLKWQFFLLDFCYFGNLFCFLFIWASPFQSEVATVLFGIANGPIAWATVLFRNSLVFHDYDKMISTYIHVLPVLLAYCVRWFPDSMSEHWYTDFVVSYNSDDVSYMMIWVVAVPMAGFYAHALLYTVAVYCICRPGPEYLHSFTYLGAKENAGCTGRCISCCGRNTKKRGKFMMYNFLNMLYCTLSMILMPVWYKYFIAHTLYVIGILLAVTWNGGSYYMDVFGKKSHV